MKNMFYIPRLETLEERNLLDAGSLDPSFGVGGIAIPGFDIARDVHQEALEPDGKIVVVGSYSPVPQRNFAVARYNSDGSPDMSFGQGGFVLVTDLVGMGYGVAIQNDGKIVALASTVQGFVMARLNTDGSMDSSFGTGGIVKTEIDPTFLGTRVVFQPDGRILVVGETTIFPDTHVGYPGYAVARYNVDGSLDKSFGVDGIATYSFFN